MNTHPPSDHHHHHHHPDAQQIRVLHVDDEPGFADLTADFLRQGDDRFDITTATTPEAGLAHLADHDVDCVVSDYDMPGMNGLEFLARLRQDAPDVPFILFTGKGSETIASEAISSGVTDYLQKQGCPEQYDILRNRVRNAVEQVWAQRERTRHLDAIETAREGIAILDSGGRYSFVNRAYADLHGTTPDALHGTSWESVYDADERPRLREILASARTTGQGQGVTVGRAADGTESVREHSCSRTERGEVVCTVRDVTELRRNVEALERAHGRIELVLENINAGIWEYDPDSGAVTSSPDPCPVMGDGVDCDLDFFAKIRPADRSRVRTAIERAVETGEQSTVEFRTTADVDADWVKSSIDPITDDTGAVTLVAGFTHDITERKRDARELRRQNERLEEFATIVSHDLQSPLSIATGQLELARMEADSERLEAVARALDRSQELIDGLLELAREESTPEVEPVDLADVVDDCADVVSTGDATLVVATDRTVRANPCRLHQLVENLVRNAVEHGSTNNRTETPSGDSVEHGEPGVTITVGDLDDGFYVEDDGAGIPKSTRERVFEHGYSTKDGGSGLGLAIVTDVVETHGWHLRVRDGTDGGARFEISGVQSG